MSKIVIANPSEELWKILDTTMNDRKEENKKDRKTNQKETKKDELPDWML